MNRTKSQWIGQNPEPEFGLVRFGAAGLSSRRRMLALLSGANRRNRWIPKTRCRRLVRHGRNSSSHQPRWNAAPLHTIGVSAT